ncbi:MAG: hypothetical protein ACOYXU_08180 [Nitrospirota bacterium]
MADRGIAANPARGGTAIQVTEKLLNHVTGAIRGVAAVYNRYSYLDEMREAVRRHDDFLSGVLWCERPLNRGSRQK